MSYLDKLQPVSSTTNKPNGGYLSKLQPVSEEIASQKKEDGGSGGGFVKSLASAPATILARPVQAIAELAGAKSEDVDRISSKLSGGLVKPVPQNNADVKKDVGRGIQTVALGLGPVSGGAAFGFGNSLEQGNDIFSTQTAFQTALGAGAGKALDLVGKPLLDAAGKVIGKITPQVLQDIAKGGTKAIEDFAARHAILPDTLSKGINAGATKLENLANKPFSAASSLIGRSPENLAQKSYQKNLQDVSDTIYPRLTPTEKAQVQLKTEGSSIFKKDVPDLINDPKTKPVIESVADLPEDIKIKRSDSVAQAENKLNQGISRMHQDTDAYLFSKKTTTPFNGSRYDKYMSDNVLKPVLTEYGADSIEARATQEAIETGKSLIKSNDAHGVYEARQKFQMEMKRKYPNAFKKQAGSLGAMLDPRVNARLEAARAYREALGDFTGELLPPNDPYKPRIKQESNLLRAKEELRKRGANQLGKNDVTRFLDRNLKVKKGVDLAKRAILYSVGSHL